MVRHSLKILNHLLHDFKSVSDHFCRGQLPLLPPGLKEIRIHTIANVPVHLTILTGKSCVLRNSAQGMAAWLLLVFFICLYNQLSSVYSIVTY